MSTTGEINDLAVAVATEFKADRTKFAGNTAGTLGSLATTDKTSLVAAINEVLDVAETAAGGGISEGEVQTLIDTSIASLVDGAPGTLNTLNELAAALSDDASYAATITTALGLKAPLASPTFTGTVTVPDGSFTIAKTTGLQTALDGKITAFSDPGADRIVFWDDSANSFVALTASSGLTISGTSITVDAASATVAGRVELATDAETATGTDTARAITPANLRFVLGDQATDFAATFTAALA